MTNKVASAPRKASDLARHWEKALAEAAAGREWTMSYATFASGWKKRFGDDVLELVVVPKRTLARRKKNREPLSKDETDKALRLVRISAHADRVFGGQERADRWMRTANPKFSGQTPFALLKTEAGAALVDETLYQIEYGIFA